MRYRSTASDKPINDFTGTVGALYGWPTGCWITLLEFTEHILQQQRIACLNEQHKTIVAAMARTMEAAFRDTPSKDRTIPYRGETRQLRHLEKELKSCARWLNGITTTTPPLKPQDWIIWNIAPFFRRRANDSIAWRNVVRFLNCIQDSQRLSGKRRSDGSDLHEGSSVLALEAKRMEFLYKHIPSDTPLDPKIQRLRNLHFRKRADTPHKDLHDRAYETLTRLRKRTL